MTMAPDEVARRCAEICWAQDAASKHLDMELREAVSGRAVLAMRVQDFMINGWDMCHGGYVSTFADSAFAFACNSHNEVTVASGFDISFLLPARLGDELVATAVERVRQGRNGIYDVTVNRDGGEIIAEMRGRSRSLGRAILD